MSKPLKHEMSIASDLRNRITEIDRRLSRAILAYETEPLAANTAMLQALQDVRYLSQYANDIEELHSWRRKRHQEMLDAIQAAIDEE